LTASAIVAAAMASEREQHAAAELLAVTALSRPKYLRLDEVQHEPEAAKAVALGVVAPTAGREPENQEAAEQDSAAGNVFWRPAAAAFEAAE
jgi:hypothetical protein